MRDAAWWDAAWTVDVFGNWEVVLEVMSILHSLYFPRLQLWKLIASQGNGDLWEEVWFREAWPTFCGRRAMQFGKCPSQENHKW